MIGGLTAIATLAWLTSGGWESANLNLILAVLDLATQVLIISIGAVLVLNPSLLVHQVDLGSTPMHPHLIFALSLAKTDLVHGIGTVSNMAEEVVDPGRDVLGGWSTTS